MTITTIRVATLSDTQALNELKRDASLVSDEYRSALSARPELLTVPSEDIRDERVLIAEVESAPSGMISVELQADGLEVTGLFVAPARWRGGVGRALIEAAVARYSRRPDEPVRVVAGPDAEAFYSACGFVSQGATTTLLGPAVEMIRTRSSVPHDTDEVDR